LQRKGDYAGAGQCIRLAITIQRGTFADHPVFVETLNLFALQQWYEGNLAASRSAGEHAVFLARRSLRPDHPMIPRSLTYLAGTLIDLGDLEEGRRILEQALAVAERSFGIGHFETWAYLNDLAVADLYRGAYPPARALFDRALHVAEGRLGAWNDRVATTLNNLALVDARLGDYESARRENAQATDIWEGILGKNHAFVARALMDLATVHREQGAADEALPLLERALSIRRQALVPGHRDIASTLADIAVTSSQLGEMAAAEEAANEAISIWERADAPDAPEFATALALLGDLHRTLGHLDQSQRYYERALAIDLKVLGAAHPDVAATQMGLARTFAAAGNPLAAVDLAARAESTAREHLRLVLRYLPQRQALTYALSRPRGLDLILSLADAVPQATRDALDRVIRSRGIVFNEVAARNAPKRDDPDTARLRQAFASAQQRSVSLRVRGPGQLSPERYLAVLDEAKRDSESAERSLAAHSATFNEEHRLEQVGIAEVTKLIPPNAAMISFVQYERTMFDHPGPDRANGPGLRVARETVPSYVALVVRPHESPIAVQLGDAAAIDALVMRWRGDISSEAADSENRGASRTPSRVSGEALRALVWDPIGKYVASARLLFIVPDGALGIVPFAALPVDDRDYLIEHAPIMQYLSTERDLVQNSETTTAASHGLLAMGGPAFDANPSEAGRPVGQILAVSAGPFSRATRSIGDGCIDLQGVTFQALAGSREEVRDVAGLWRHQPDAGAATAQVFVGAHASERAFKEQAPGHRILHLATHGFFLDGSCNVSVPGTRAVGGLQTSAGGTPARTNFENPLQLSGLALAGANRRAAARPDEDDGILTAEEVASMNLRGVEWAVLSACDTGLGAVQAGEGVFGLRRAFLVAGARTVIMSLWSVDDQAARSWMRSLYDGRLRGGLSTADAVHAATLGALKERRARGQSTLPFYWAAFVAVGDWH
jgi:CHAT domain-containing protein/tetratricopeptide (TPR) repeat protein